MLKMRGLATLAAVTVLTMGLLGSAFGANAKPKANGKPSKVVMKNVMDELNPFSPDIDKQLEAFDKDYESKMLQNPWVEKDMEFPSASMLATGCYRSACAVYAYVRRSDQRLYLYINGNPYAEWPVSTGIPGMDTPDFDRHPNGRIYDMYSSTTFPGGNYQGLGNMPYAVFIEGGFAIHGTGKGNWRRLGQRASHGCIRVHPDNAFTFNRLVRQYGVKNVWVTVSE